MKSTETVDATEFRAALRGEMAAVSTPAGATGPDAMLAMARRAEQRRRRTIAGAASALAVTAVAVGAVVAVGTGPSSPTGLGGLLPGVAPTASITPTASTAPTAPASVSGSAKGTDPAWPSGQTDATARSGPEYERGAALLDAVSAVVPAGYDPGEVTVPGYAGPLRHHESQVDLGPDNQATGWTYEAMQPLSKGGGTGILLVEVTTPGVTPKSGPCALAQSFWGMGGQCHVQQVHGLAVGVVTSSPDRRLDGWAAYQYPDGTAVFVAQAKAVWAVDFPGMARDPYSLDQLAALAVRPEFKVG